MAPPRGTKRKSSSKPGAGLSGSRSPAAPPTEKTRGTSAASGSSPAPPRVGHARSFSSPSNAKTKVKGKTTSPALSAAGGGGRRGWGAKDDGVDDFAFDKMSESEDEEEQEEKEEEEEATASRPRKSTRAGAPSKPPAARRNKGKASVAPFSGGKGKAAAAGGDGPKKPTAAAKPVKRGTAAAAAAAAAAASTTTTGAAAKSSAPAPPKSVSGAASAAAAAAPRKRRAGKEAPPAKSNGGSAKKEVVDVMDEQSESASGDGDGDSGEGDGNGGDSDWDQGLGSIAARKGGKGRESGGGKGSGSGAGVDKKNGRRKARPSAAATAAPVSRRRSSPSSGKRKVVTVGAKGSDVDLTQEEDEEEEGDEKGKAEDVDTASEEAAPPPPPSKKRKKKAGGKGSDVDLTQEEQEEEEEEEEEEKSGDFASEQLAAPPAPTKAEKVTVAAAGPANGSGKQATGAGGKGKGKGKGKAKEGGGSGSGRSSTMSSAKPTKLAGDVAIVLRKLRKLRGDMARGGGGGIGSAPGDGDGGPDAKKTPTLLELGLSGNVTEVREMNAAGVMDEIERIAVETALSIMEGKGFGFRVPTRSSGNQKYVEELDRIVLGDKVSHRNFVSTAMARKTAITTRVVELVHQVLGKGIHITKRDMFYTDVKLFKDQSESDNVLDDVACMVGCTRSCLNVVASDKGLVVGRVTFLEDGDLIDCTRMGVGGKAIPPYIDKITDIRSDADFILLVEKEAAYMRMAEDRFYQKYPCIVITAKGQPDVATRLFLKRLKRELNIPVMGLVDSDPYGLKILSVYMSGSKNMSYDSASLTTPDIKWLGVRPSDLDRYNIPEQCRLDMTEHDIKTGKELLQEDFIKKNEPWCRELELMIKSKKKAEIQSLSAFGFQYLTHTYLPQKLQNGDWV